MLKFFERFFCSCLVYNNNAKDNTQYKNKFDFEQFFNDTKQALNVREATYEFVPNLDCPAQCNFPQIQIRSDLLNIKKYEDIISLKNTIYHEMIHVRNHEKLPPEHKEIIFGSFRSKVKMGYKLLDEAQAYKEAQDKYKELKIDHIASEERLEIAFFSNPIEKHFQDYGVDRNRMFINFYNNISVLIMSYIMKGLFRNKILNESVEYLLNIADDPLETKSLKDFETAVEEFIKILFHGIPNDKQALFQENTGIDDLNI